MALMLSLARQIPAADAAMKRGVWEKKKFTGEELRGKTLGIVGLGRIGQEVGARARVVRHEPRRARSVHLRAGRGARSASSCCRSTSCARTSDYITLHLPATPETRHLFNAERLAKCKAGVRIVNTARGELIDESGARRCDRSAARSPAPALDVFEKEPPPDWRLAEAAAGRRDAAHRRVDRARRRNRWASRPRSPCAISCATASSATP